MEAGWLAQRRTLTGTTRIFQREPVLFFLHHWVSRLMDRLVRVRTTEVSNNSSRKGYLNILITDSKVELEAPVWI